jgi:D-sedoheptulose 7-phosphate isomerase
MMRSLRPEALAHVEEVLVRCPALASVRDEMIAAAEAICACHRAGGKVLVCGNGGSAADSEHIVGELVKGFVLPRRIPEADIARIRAAAGADPEMATELAGRLQGGVSALSLTGHPALATAMEILICLSTSGNSGNVLHALTVARAQGLRTIGFNGSRPAKMDALCDIQIKVPETVVYKVQELHLPAYHTICLMVEQELFGAAP